MVRARYKSTLTACRTPVQASGLYPRPNHQSPRFRQQSVSQLAERLRSLRCTSYPEFFFNLSTQNPRLKPLRAFGTRHLKAGRFHSGPGNMSKGGSQRMKSEDQQPKKAQTQTKCPHCNGTGRILLSPSTSNKQVSCAKCAGTGLLLNGKPPGQSSIP